MWSREQKLFYGKWKNMISRCYNELDKDYKNYGGRGITICEEWRDSFLSFYEWALDNEYQEGLTIDRINNDKGYSPDNCEWKTRKEQQRNRRNCHYFTDENGKDWMIEDIHLAYGIPLITLHKRASRNPNFTFADMTKPIMESKSSVLREKGSSGKLETL